ncbi:MAG: MotA/TolQ/ExbB proton channel family protein, partial [Candidatus Atribacteria bacterium]|nr:MotA/TolQ/ExbB proton channel family protein [Candidatus Atribacteria bacterium]
DNFMLNIKENIRLNKKDEALNICDNIKNPIGKILKKGIYHLNDGVVEMYQQMDEAKLHEFPKYERHLGLLNFIGKISPTMGLLGTVTGMIKTFHYLSLNVEAQQLAEGISEALITTAFGLIISIPSLGAYYYFLSKFEQMVTHTEKREIELTNYVRKSGVSYEKISN